MYLYAIDGENLNKINEVSFKNEYELHKLCENNLETIFGLKFVKREFKVNNFRIDTLAFDENNKSFVIIEYKNTNSFSVVDQGYAYLSLMLNNKSDFILEYNENCNKALRRDDVDWSQSRVIFVSPNFNSYQKQSINFRDLPFELWEVKKFNNDVIYFNPINPSKNFESIKTIATNNENIEEVNKEVMVYTEEMHYENGTEDTIDLYNQIKDYILSLDSNISIKATKIYIGFLLNNKNMVDILIQKRALKIWLNDRFGNLQDYKGLFKDVSNIGHWGNGDYEIKITDNNDIEYIFSIIKDLYKKRKET